MSAYVLSTENTLSCILFKKWIRTWASVLPAPSSARPVRSLCPGFCLPLQPCSPRWGAQPCEGGPCTRSVPLAYGRRRWGPCRRSPAVWLEPLPSCHSGDVLSFDPSDPLLRLALSSAVWNSASSAVMRWSRRLLKTYEGPALYFSLPSTPPQTFCCPFLFAFCFPNITSRLPGERTSLGAECDGAGLTSVHCPDAWPGDVYYSEAFFYWAHTHSHTHTGLTLGWRVREKEGWLPWWKQSVYLKKKILSLGSAVFICIYTNMRTQPFIVSGALMIHRVTRHRVRILRTAWTAVCNWLLSYHFALRLQPLATPRHRLLTDTTPWQTDCGPSSPAESTDPRSTKNSTHWTLFLESYRLRF